MFTAVSGLKVHQTALDVTANNVANVNTVGYRSSRATFVDIMSQTQRSGSAPAGGSGGSLSVLICGKEVAQAASSRETSTTAVRIGRCAVRPQDEAVFAITALALSTMGCSFTIRPV